MTGAVVEISDDLTSDVIEIMDQSQDSVIEISGETAVAVIEILSAETLPGPPGADGPEGPTGPPGAAGATVLTYTAGIDLSGHRIVVLDAETKVIYADHAVMAHGNKVLGMTIGASMAGEDAVIQTGGELVEPSWNWTLDVPIWLGSNGMLSQVVPAIGFSLIIGFPVAATKIFIDIREPIFLI